jgi:hypothetical protein
VCDCPDLVSCALAAVAASANTNAIASRNMTAPPLARGTSARRRDSVSATVGEELGARMTAIHVFGGIHISRREVQHKTGHDDLIKPHPALAQPRVFKKNSFENVAAAHFSIAGFPFTVWTLTPRVRLSIMVVDS